ncbi:DUF1553 domain-containing protein [Blastopirellula sp. JC732]|uniref:DUF1553 domain-containing protein n=1 Tax=Blastopirellula sediminis TaxID=2894196 RepID=A0A9X1SH69_9BACT|nr:DUF1553 domain-containing protein [Blastopirellula sediminis]MCC9607221.1 DUF1553 domain-containing protein [Blastopirellula sediminis]MCC9629486.1 DUF1553 domain-containing protein [Blastopirellula sediminis]
MTSVCFLVLGAVVSQGATYRELIETDSPVLYLSFDADELGKIQNEAPEGPQFSAAEHGPLKLTVGAAAPQYPLFDVNNRALELAKEPGRYVIEDPGAESPLDFAAGDPITIEAWVSPQHRAGSYFYIIGKGRTHRAGFSPDNQNWSLRLCGNSSVGISFLYRDADNASYHRWDSEQVIAVGDGWHHVAVTYVFGEKGSLHGYVDGQPVKGKWDMGGDTGAAPLVDDDQVWIGSAMGGQAGSSFHGQIDEVALYRSVLPADAIKTRFRYEAPKPTFDVAQLPLDAVRVELYEGIPNRKSWDFREPRFIEAYEIPAFAFLDARQKYNGDGVRVDRPNPYLLRAAGRVTLPEGEHRLLVRSRNSARVFIDGELQATTPFHNISGSAHGTVFDPDRSLAPNIRPLARGDQEKVITITGDGKEHVVAYEMIVGGGSRRQTFGESSVSLATPEGDFHLLSPLDEFQIAVTDETWLPFAADQRQMYRDLDFRRRAEIDEARPYWEKRHAHAKEYVAGLEAIEVPSLADLADPYKKAVHGDIDHFLNVKLAEAEEPPTGPISDLAFLRRLSLDIVGQIPSPELIAQYQQQPAGERRTWAINRLLADQGWADNWVGYWQDTLAENPSLVKPTLNNTGPFRWYLYEAFLDNKPFDRIVTELVMMEGSARVGGAAGFGIASQNDSPMAAKAFVLGQAFLGVQMKCARCHDAPYHDIAQADLFGMGAMLNRSQISVPKSSTVPGGGRQGTVKSVLKPGEKISPHWAFEQLKAAPDEAYLNDADDSREQLALLMTAPENSRFAQVIVNRVWQRLMGRGFVEMVDDWENADPTHPELLEYLARDFIAHGYDMKHLTRQIVSSDAYQRSTVEPSPFGFNFAGPATRRMTAEQVVDSLFAACEKPLDAGSLNIDIDGALNADISTDFGVPVRAWEFVSLTNERDRPSLAKPFAAPFVVTLESFGWTGSRQNPIAEREKEPNVLQPAILANGELGERFTRLSDDNVFTKMALEDVTLDELTRRLFLRVLTREPDAEELAIFRELLSPGFQERRVDAPIVKRDPLPRGLVAWTNHLNPRANEIVVELEHVVRKGDLPTQRLTPEWRTRMEDALWALLNTPEFVFVP